MYRPLRVLWKLSIDGVADPSTTRAPLPLSPDDRDVARVIPRRLLLLVGGVVLFVDDDETDVGQGSEDRRARADDHIDRAAVNAMPLVMTLAVGQAAVLNGDPFAQGPAEGRGHGRG